jgi:hypothetical protein
MTTRPGTLLLLRSNVLSKYRRSTPASPFSEKPFVVSTQREQQHHRSPKKLPATMAVRHRVTLSLMLFLSFVAFASYHKGTGSTAWLQWLTLVVFLFFGYAFDVMFTNSSMFMFDPDADNWRRKTEALGK